MDVSSLILEVPSSIIASADNKSHASRDLREGLETIASRATSLLPMRKELKISKKNIGFVAAKIERGDIVISSIFTSENMMSSSVTKAKNSSSVLVPGVLASMTLPESTFNDKEVSLFSFSYRSNALFVKDGKVTTGSAIISATVGNKKLENLVNPINITFKVSETVAEDDNPNCTFWDEENGNYYI